MWKVDLYYLQSSVDASLDFVLAFTKWFTVLYILGENTARNSHIKHNYTIISLQQSGIVIKIAL